MKKVLLISLVILSILYAFKQLVYNPYKWKKTINTPEHKLQLGSFIFSKQRGSNGSQSMQTNYFIFKVIEINGDYVRLSVIRQLSEKDKIKSGFSTKKEDYKELKDSIQKVTITPIPSEDLYKGDASFTVNDYLLDKYPSIQQSRYYFEDVKSSIHNTREYFSLVYSKEKIITKGKLVPWIISNSDKPELAERLSENIELIVN